MTKHDLPHDGALETGAFIERTWFHLDQGWVDLAAEQIPEKREREARKVIEDAATHLMREMTSQYSSAVVAGAYHRAAWKRAKAPAMDLPSPRPAINVEGELLGIYSKSYVFGLDGVEGCAFELSKMIELPEAVRSAARRLCDELKWVRRVRDSLQHVEERVQGKAHSKRIPASLLMLGGHSDSGFSTTIDDGTLVTIEVSEAILGSIRSHLAALDRALVWRRAGRPCPRCGGNFNVEVVPDDPSRPDRPNGIAWSCRRCGLRERIDAAPELQPRGSRSLIARPVRWLAGLFRTRMC